MCFVSMRLLLCFLDDATVVESYQEQIKQLEAKWGIVQHKIFLIKSSDGSMSFINFGSEKNTPNMLDYRSL